jgi:hypothetical protein
MNHRVTFLIHIGIKGLLSKWALEPFLINAGLQAGDSRERWHKPFQRLTIRARCPSTHTLAVGFT